MISAFFPLKKLRRNGKYLLFGTILLIGFVAVYHEMVAARAWSSDTGMSPDADSGSWRRAMFDERVRRDHHPDSIEDSAAWRSSYISQTWKPEYKGQANLHVFEDWCGSSTADLHKNMHYPLYPHSRTTVQKLAVSPQWTNYGLRIFGYLHPYADGEFVFGLSSDDNSEFWLSTDESPLNVQLLAWVGRTGTEWTAPGEFEKFVSQTSRPVWLSAQRRYFFEVIHKQDDKGTDHVEVAVSRTQQPQKKIFFFLLCFISLVPRFMSALCSSSCTMRVIKWKRHAVLCVWFYTQWQLLDKGFRFMVIESSHISLYINESALLLSDIAHIPQTTASHQHTPTKQHVATADMLREDPRDTLYRVPLMNHKFLQGVLPDCSYKPSYTIKDFPLLRYQGLQFVHMSYIYPNDYTRLTHMESQNSCFYPERPYYMKMFGFSRYMRLDRPGRKEKENTGRDFGFQRRNSMLDEEDEFDDEAYQREKEIMSSQINNALFPDYGDDYDDYAQKRKRKLFSFVTQETSNTPRNASNTRLHVDELQGKDGVPQLQSESQKKVKPLQLVPTRASKHHSDLQQNHTELNQTGQVKNVEQIRPKAKSRQAKRQKLTSVKSAVRGGETKPAMQQDREKLKIKEQPLVPPKQLNSKQHHIQRPNKMNHTQIQRLKDSEKDPPQPRRFVTSAVKKATNKQLTTSNRDHPLVKLNQRDTDARERLRDKEIELNMPLQQDLENGIRKAKMNAKGSKDKKQLGKEGKADKAGEEDEVRNRVSSRRDTRENQRDSLWGPRGDFEGTDDEDRTPAPVFDTEVNWSQTFQVNHLDLQAQRSDWIDLHCNVSGNLLLHSSDALPMVKSFMDQLNKKHHRRFTLVRVVNVVKRVDGVQGSRYLLELEVKDSNGQLLRLSHYIYSLIRYSMQRSSDSSFQQQKPQLLLCNPMGFRWNPAATVHFIVPVKNQARWVQQLISDMEQLFRDTRDTNFNLIITDYNSTDMDIKEALKKSSLPRYEYVKLSGNFERSAGLQAGINLINDDHSIVFLCDLHIHFPPSIIDTIRKHCVEGYMAFAPIVLRLDCGATPLEARGYWEVNGFGLLGIYKSDLDAVGGMNTREFRERWGGEDWELLDRILQAGLEVERIYLRNFFHRYHSKRGMWNRRMSPSPR